MPQGLLEETPQGDQGAVQPVLSGGHRVRQHVAILFLYAAVSVLLFGGPILRDPLHTYLGIGIPRTYAGYTDPSFYMWNFVWWPHAIGHGLNPLISHAVWAPDGFSLAAAQTSPPLSLVLSPITLLFGPIASYNVVMLLAPALAAWTAYLLCRRITRSFWPSVAGGYFFGFSSYEISHLTDHPNLACTFLVPLAVYLVVRRLEGSLRPRQFIGFLTAVLVLQFFISPEIFLTLSMFGLMVGGLAIWWYRREHDGAVPPSIHGVFRNITVAYGLTVLAASPYVAFAIAHGLPQLPAAWPFNYVGDLANVVVPTRVSRFGGTVFIGISDRFRASVDESGAYLGLLPVIIVLFALQRPRRLLQRILTWSLVVIGVASLGPTLTVAGSRIIALPWSIVAVLPILKLALPARFVMYAWLIVALIVALWLASPGRRTRMKWALAVASAVLLLPNTSSPFWRNTPPVPRFFSSGLYRQYLRPAQNVLVIPYGGISFAMLWQAQSDFWFSMPEGRLCPMPQDYQTWPIVRTLRGGPLAATHERDLRQFLSAKHVERIVVVEGTPGPWRQLFGGLGVEPRRAADVLVYAVPNPVLETPLSGQPRPVVKELRGDCG